MATIGCIPAPSDLSTMRNQAPQNSGHDNRTEPKDLHVVIPNATEAWSNNQARATVVGGEAVDMVITTVDIMPKVGVAEAPKAMMMRGMAIIPMMRVMHLMIGGTQETSLNPCHTHRE